MKLVKFVIALLLVFNLSQALGQVLDTLCSPAIGKYGVHGSPGSTYWWTATGGTIITPNGLDTIVVDWRDDPGIYDLQVVEMSVNGCPGDTVYAKIIVFGGTEIFIAGPDSLCQGDGATLTCSTNGFLNDWEWNTGDTTTTIYIMPLTTTTYSVIRYGYCDSDTATHTVKVNPLPVADFIFQPSYPEVFDPVQFNYTGSTVVSYNWYSNYHGFFSNQDNPYLIYTNPVNDVITLEVWNKYGCYDTITKPLEVLAFPKLFVPNSFTPNDDGLNDLFKAIGHNISQYNLSLFDRWGNLLFETTNLDKGWDGTFNGIKCAGGTAYAWIIKYRGLGDPNAMDDRVVRGTVTLLR